MGWKSYFRVPLPKYSLPQLDGLRAIAVMVVFWGHAVHIYNVDGSVSLFKMGPVDLAYWVFGVAFGADLFLMLSGLLITGSLLRHWNPNGRNRKVVKSYALNRFLRIFPPYAVMVILTATGLFYTTLSQNPWQSVGEHLLFMQDYGANDLNISYWAMALEAKFYVAMPIVLFLMHKFKLWHWRYGVMGALLLTPVTLRYLTPLDLNDYFIIHTEATATPFVTLSYLSVFRTPFHLYFDAFAAGSFLAFLWHDREKLKAFWAGIWPRILMWVGFIGLLIVAARPPRLTTYLNVPDAGHFIEPYSPIFLQFGFAFFIMLIYLGVLAGHGPQRLLASKPLRYLAQISFSFYLVHWAALKVWESTQLFLYQNVLHMNIDPMTSVPFIITKVIGGFVLTLIFSLVLYYAAEKPFMMMKRS